MTEKLICPECGGDYVRHLAIGKLNPYMYLCGDCQQRFGDIREEADKVVSSPIPAPNDKDLTDIQKDVLEWAKKRSRSAVTHRRFMPEDGYVQGFKDRGETVPPFIVLQPFEIREGVRGYLVPCKPDHPEAEVEVEA